MSREEEQGQDGVRFVEELDGEDGSKAPDGEVYRDTAIKDWGSMDGVQVWSDAEVRFLEDDDQTTGAWVAAWVWVDVSEVPQA